MRWGLGLCMLSLAGSAPGAYEPPSAGAPSALTDWRWLARPLVGRRQVVADPWGQRQLPRSAAGLELLKAAGPGVLDHLWTTRRSGTITILVDGRTLWKGAFQDLDKDKDAPLGPFPRPLVFSGGGMCHLAAPVGFRQGLVILVDQEPFPLYAAYRTLPPGAAVLPADADPGGEYARLLKSAAEVWSRQGFGLWEQPARPAEPVVQEFMVQARTRATALERKGSGEVVGLEFHVYPALTGSLRHVVVECYYDGAREPALRLPITDLAGVPHPWPAGRWDGYNGDLVAGIRYPWYVHTPRHHYPEATFHLNLPMPFAEGLRIDLVNRSEHMRFAGYTRAVVQALEPAAARQAGRLCGTRTLTELRPDPTPRPLLRMPGPGQVAALSLFLAGIDAQAAALRDGSVALTLDQAEPITGHGLVPLGFQGIYRGNVLNQPLWNHPRYEAEYVGCTRHFLTDPIPFAQEAAFAYRLESKSVPPSATATAAALWYRFGPTAYAAPALADRAEPLPHSTFPNTGVHRLGPDQQPSQLAWAIEAEELAPMATVHGGQVGVVEDVDHNYHPSAGRYLHVVADQAGDYVDCAVRLPHTRYVAIGWNVLWGPNRGTFEIDLLSRSEARQGPSFPQGPEFFTGRALGSVPMQAPIRLGQSLGLRRDPNTEFTPPFRNPAPDGTAVLRLVCQTKPMDSHCYLLKLDQVRLDMPPATRPGWHEFEAMRPPRLEGEVTAVLPKYGRFAWSGWGAVVLTAQAGAKATWQVVSPTGPAQPRTLCLRGSLGPDQGAWQARWAGSAAPTELKPGADDQAVVQWRLPVPGLRLPGELVLEIACTAPGRKDPRLPKAPPAVLALDAWTCLDR